MAVRETGDRVLDPRFGALVLLVEPAAVFLDSSPSEAESAVLIPPLDGLGNERLGRKP